MTIIPLRLLQLVWEEIFFVLGRGINLPAQRGIQLLFPLRTAAYQRGKICARRSTWDGGEKGRPRPSRISPAAPPSTSSVTSRLPLSVNPELSLIATRAFCPEGRSTTSRLPIPTES